MSTHADVSSSLRGDDERCSGCGARVARVEGPVHRYMLSAPACWERYGALLSTLAGDSSTRIAVQYAVDAFAAQHPGMPNPQAIQSVGVHLLNAYGYLELGRPVDVPQFAGHKGGFVWLEPPAFRDAVTVHDVPTTGDAGELEASTRAWMASVWNAWAPHHAQIKEWYARYATRRTDR